MSRQSVDNNRLGEYPVKVTIEGAGATKALIQHVNLDTASEESKQTYITDPVNGNQANVIPVNGYYGAIAIAPGHISTNNSTTTPLGASETFTGEFEEIINFGVIVIAVKSDQASATDGLKIEFSCNGTDIILEDCFTIEANTGKSFSFQSAARYFRVSYLNGTTEQTLLRIQTCLKPYYVKPSSHRIQDAITTEDDAELVKAVITGKTPSGVFVNVVTTEDGDLKISDNSDGLAIAEGKITGKSFVHKFGNAPDFDSADGIITVWDGAQDGSAWELMRYVYSTTADIDSISSDSAADTQEIEVQGLDANYELVTQMVTLNGQTRVALTTPLIRVFRAFNNNGTNLVGHVFIYVNGTITGGIPDTNADIRVVIDPTNQQTEMALYTIPAGKTGYLRSWYASTAGASKDSAYSIRLLARDFGKVFRLQHIASVSDNGSSAYNHPYIEPGIYTEKTDLEIQTEMFATGGTGGTISAGFDLVLVDND